MRDLDGNASFSPSSPVQRLRLGEYRHWVFDMDGTLTLAVHDFALIRRELDIPATRDILEHWRRWRRTKRLRATTG